MAPNTDKAMDKAVDLVRELMGVCLPSCRISCYSVPWLVPCSAVRVVRLHSSGGQPEYAWVLLGKKPAANPQPAVVTAAPAAAVPQLTLTSPSSPTAGTQAEAAEAAPTAERARKGKERVPPPAAASSSSAAGPSSSAASSGAASSHAAGKKRAREPAVTEAAPSMAPAFDLTSFNAAQLAELQVRIAQQLQGAS